MELDVQLVLVHVSTDFKTFAGCLPFCDETSAIKLPLCYRTILYLTGVEGVLESCLNFCSQSCMPVYLSSWPFPPLLFCITLDECLGEPTHRPWTHSSLPWYPHCLCTCRTMCVHKYMLHCHFKVWLSLEMGFRIRAAVCRSDKNPTTVVWDYPLTLFPLLLSFESPPQNTLEFLLSVCLLSIVKHFSFQLCNRSTFPFLLIVVKSVNLYQLLRCSDIALFHMQLLQHNQRLNQQQHQRIPLVAVAQLYRVVLEFAP